jgi:alpha-ketoglutaric semialdehyde dehydrogenase
MTGTQIIGSSDSAESGNTFKAFNPSTGETLEPPFHEATENEVDAAMSLASEAALVLRGFSGERLGQLCATIADKLDATKAELLERCGLETGYPEARLHGEFARTVGQMRAFGKVARDGAWRTPRIDHGEPARQPLPKPDVRSILVPLGPVAVFGASNFPLALSAAGGDTASALAAGCPVVVKGHPSHPGTCEIAARAIAAAVSECGFPEGTFSMVQGVSNVVGIALTKHPSAAAVGFTGSLRGGRALFDIAAARETPIPVYAEMGSVNPQFVLGGKLRADPEAFAAALFSSATLGNGQFCTNPGLVFLPQGNAYDAFLEKYRSLVASASPAPLLNLGIQTAFDQGLKKLENLPGIEVQRGPASHEGYQTGPAIATMHLGTFETNRHTVEEEVFGPSTVVVSCPDSDDFPRIAAGFPGQLASSVHGTEEDLAQCQDLIDTLARYAGRVCVNGFPTGIEICHAMHHGSIYPAATDSHHTSIGLGAIARWGRPVSYQDLPDHLLPDALKEANPLGLVRLVDGELRR